jgi:hypothetical protein
MTKLAILILSLSAASAAIAENTAPQLDPNEVLCRTVRATGSRLAASRRCATRAQWLEDERAQRTWLAERQTRQTQPSCMTPGERARVNGRQMSPTAAGGGHCGY